MQKLALPQDAFILLSAASGLRTSPYKDYASLKKAVALASQKSSKLLLVALGASQEEANQKKAKPKAVKQSIRKTKKSKAKRNSSKNWQCPRAFFPL